MATLAAYPGMMQRARRREGLRVCRAAWLLGISVREYREIEAGDRTPNLDECRRISELYGWPQTFVVDRTEKARMADSTLEIVGTEPSERDGILLYRVMS